MKTVERKISPRTNGPIWMMFECAAGSRWMSTTEDSTNDVCSFSGCGCGSIVRKMGETDDRSTDWFGLRAGKSRAYPRLYDNLWVNHLTPARHHDTCGYWYTVTAGTFSHVAFANRESLDRWLGERGLTIDDDISAEGTSSRITGAYRTTSHMDMTEFDALTGLEVRQMDNADYTRATVTIDDDGLRNVHYLNCNIRSRHVYDRAESNKLYG